VVATRPNQGGLEGVLAMWLQRSAGEVREASKRVKSLYTRL
jgi:hypothetical protein